MDKLEVLESYNENGFYIAKGLIDKNFVDETIVSLKKHFDNQLSL